MTKGKDGFTLIEMMIAIIVLSIGLLGLASTMALATRMAGRGQRSAMAATYATQQMERSRIAACIPAQRVGGSESLMRGGGRGALNNWALTDAGPRTHPPHVTPPPK